MPEISIPAYCHLTRPAAVLRVTGPDAFAFLQSQFSNDLNNPEVENPVTYGLWLDHKGKIQADSFVIQQTRENFLLMSYDCAAAVLRAHLEAHLIADEVELRDETGEFGLLHVWAEEFSEDIQALVESIAGASGCEPWMGRRPSLRAAWDFLAPPALFDDVAKSLTGHGVEAVSAEELQAARIIAGVPAVPVDAGPGDLPQEAGLHREGVSFDKGCYLGQEVMARLHSQGHVNRALWQVGWDGCAPEFSPGPVALFAGETPAGELRSRVTKAGRGIGIAMLKSRALVGKLALSLTPGGPEVVKILNNLSEG